MGVNGESPGLAGAFFDSVLSITDWVKLLRNVDILCLHGVKRFWGLTRKTGSVQRAKQRFGLGDGMGWRSGFLRSAARKSANCSGRNDDVWGERFFSALRMTTLN